MKHLSLILVITVGLYACWQVLGSVQKSDIKSFLITHGTRFALLLFVLFLLFILAVQSTSIQIF